MDLLQRLAKALDSAQGVRLRGVQVRPCALLLLLETLGMGFRSRAPLREAQVPLCIACICRKGQYDCLHYAAACLWGLCALAKLMCMHLVG